jgi:hypothetical protein
LAPPTPLPVDDAVVDALDWVAVPPCAPAPPTPPPTVPVVTDAPPPVGEPPDPTTVLDALVGFLPVRYAKSG